MFVLVSTPRTRWLPDPSHPGLQLTNFPQDANKLENRFYLKEKKKKSESAPFHSDPSLTGSILQATLPSQDTSECCCRREGGPACECAFAPGHHTWRKTTGKRG